MLDTVREALKAFDTVRPTQFDECDLDAKLNENPNLIIPFYADEENDSDFVIQMKKCRKPRTTKAKALPKTVSKASVAQSDTLVQMTGQSTGGEATPAGTKRTCRRALFTNSNKVHSETFSFNPIKQDSQQELPSTINNGKDSIATKTS